VVLGRSSGRGAPSQPLDDRAGGQRPAGAHRDQGVRAVGAFEFVQGRGDQPAPVLPTGWPSAIAPPLTLTLSMSGSCSRAHEARRGERLVDLEQVHVADGHAGLVEHLRRGLAGSVEVVVGVGADQRLGDDAGAGRRPSASALSRDIHSTAAAPSEICDELPAVWTPSGMTGFRPPSPRRWCRAGPGRGDGAGLAGRLALVVEDGRLDREDLAVEAALVPRPLGVPLRAQCESSTSWRVMPRSVAIRSAPTNWLGRSTSQSSGRGTPGPVQHVGPEPDPAHHLDAAGDADVDGPGAISPAMKWLACWAEPHWQSTVVQATCGGRWFGEPGVAGDVGALLAGLGDAPADDLLDVAGVDAGPGDHLLERGTEHRGRVQAGSQPLRLPMGVRTAATMTGSDIGTPRGRVRFRTVVVDSATNLTVCQTSKLERVIVSLVGTSRRRQDGRWTRCLRPRGVPRRSAWPRSRRPDCRGAPVRGVGGRRAAARPDAVNVPMIRHFCEAVGDTQPGLPRRRRPPPCPGSAGSSPRRRCSACGPWARPATPAARGTRSCGASTPRATRRWSRPTTPTSTSSTSAPATASTSGGRSRTSSGPKQTALGEGWFVTSRYDYHTEDGTLVGIGRMRLLKFRPRPAPPDGTPAAAGVRRRSAPAPPPRNQPRQPVLLGRRGRGRTAHPAVRLVRELRHPPGPMCPSCRSTDWDWQVASGRGTCYSYAVHHHPPLPGIDPPHTVVLVDLEEGVRSCRRRRPA
jgi:uncharacterized protein